MTFKDKTFEPVKLEKAFYTIWKMLILIMQMQ